MESVSYLKISIRHLNPTMRKRKPHLNIIEIQSRSQCPGFGFGIVPSKVLIGSGQLNWKKT